MASRNPVKIKAVERSFSRQFVDEQLELISVNADSGVADQPRGDEETRLGAKNRVANARVLEPEADYWVGLEGGVDVFDGVLMTFAWMVIEDRSGKVGLSRSTALPLPPEVQRLIEQGMELGDANDQVFSTVNSKQAGGAFGLLTEGLYTRTDIYAQTLTVALIPLVNPLYR